MIIKSVIRYTNGVSLEATWVDEEGNVVKCHAYDGSQMADLRADLGADAAQYEDLIAQCEADWVPPPPAPKPIIVVSPRQIRQALNAQGLRQQVEDAIAAGSQDMKDWWEFSLTIESNHPLVLEMAQQLGVTEQQLDDLFSLAGTL